VVLTNPGERLLIHAQRILRLHDEAMADLSGKGLSGTIRFGCPDDYAAVFLPPLLRQFSSQHPHALVEVVCGPTPRLLERLEKREVDLAMISLPEGSAHDDIIRREQLVWIGYPGLDSADFDPLPLALSDPDTLEQQSCGSHCAGSVGAGVRRHDADGGSRGSERAQCRCRASGVACYRCFAEVCEGASVAVDGGVCGAHPVAAADAVMGGALSFARPPTPRHPSA
jgi:DNA-binding transcriptional LysR family regulator